MRQRRRVRRLRLHAAAWGAGTTLFATLWVLNQWHANGAFRHFGNEGNPGDWNPTLLAIAVGAWGLPVAIMALRVRFERPATGLAVDREVERLRVRGKARPDAELPALARERLERIGRLTFHAAAWLAGMVVLTPLWALVEWQDNGGFERWSTRGERGGWEPWILYVAGIWALAIALLALRLRFRRPVPEPGD
ncbi:MAG: hypothetical protein IT201_01555 [Thermoleophilia bacterium]|nr:hypothetical protein [Thermoleophilia bacterium]